MRAPKYGASAEDIALVNTTKASLPDRTEILRGNPDVVGRFSSLCPFWWTFTRQALSQRSGSKRTPTSSKKANNDEKKDMDFSDASSAPDLPPPSIPVSPAVAAGIPGYKKLSSLSLDAEDASLCERPLSISDILRVKKGPMPTASSRCYAGWSSGSLMQVPGEKEVGSALKELTTLFTSAHTSVSSFELLQIA